MTREIRFSLCVRSLTHNVRSSRISSIPLPHVFVFISSSSDPSARSILDCGTPGMRVRLPGDLFTCVVALVSRNGNAVKATTQSALHMFDFVVSDDSTLVVAGTFAVAACDNGNITLRWQVSTQHNNTNFFSISFSLVVLFVAATYYCLFG